MSHPPKWLADKIQAARRKAQVARCADCLEAVIVGLDADRCALEAVIDFAPVDPVGELRGLMAGRPAYLLVRDEIHATAMFTAGTSRYAVHLAHECPGGTE